MPFHNQIAEYVAASKATPRLVDDNKHIYEVHMSNGVVHTGRFLDWDDDGIAHLEQHPNKKAALLDMSRIDAIVEY